MTSRKCTYHSFVFHRRCNHPCPSVVRPSVRGPCLCPWSVRVSLVRLEIYQRLIISFSNFGMKLGHHKGSLLICVPCVPRVPACQSRAITCHRVPMRANACHRVPMRAIACQRVPTRANACQSVPLYLFNF